MNRKQIKKELNYTFKAPSPQKRDTFLAKLPDPRTTRWDFYLIQFTYIRKRSWLFSVASVSVAFLAGYRFDNNGFYDFSSLLWWVSAVMPLLVLLLAAELSRSDIYGMSEMEMSTRYSFTQIIFARSLFLGSADLLLIGAAVYLIGTANGGFWIRTAIYLLVPYLLCCVLTLEIMRRMQGRNMVPACTAATFIVSAGYFILNSAFHLYDRDKTVYWLYLLLILLYLMIKKCIRMKKLMEEYIWNLN